MPFHVMLSLGIIGNIWLKLVKVASKILATEDDGLGKHIYALVYVTRSSTRCFIQCWL